MLSIRKYMILISLIPKRKLLEKEVNLFLQWKATQQESVIERFQRSSMTAFLLLVRCVMCSDRSSFSGHTIHLLGSVWLCPAYMCWWIDQTTCSYTGVCNKCLYSITFISADLHGTWGLPSFTKSFAWSDLRKRI